MTLLKDILKHKIEAKKFDQTLIESIVDFETDELKVFL
jgi:hypothetical protein